jgi:tagaturonate reductase
MIFSQRITDLLQKLNNQLGRLIPVTTPLGIALGFFFPHIFIHIRPFVPWLFGMMTFSGALKLRASELTDTMRKPVPILLFFAASHVIMPLAALFSSSLVFDNADVIAGFVLLFAGPTAVSGFVWVAIFKGDKALGLTLILLDTLRAPLIVPGSVSILMGAKITMDMSGIAISLLFMVVLPTILGVTLNETSKGRVSASLCPSFDPAAKLCLILVIAANASPVAPGIHFNDPLVWITALVCVLLTVFGFFLAKLNGVIGKYGDEKSVSMTISGGLRNNSAVMTIAVTFFPEAAVLPTMMSIISQQTIAAILGKFLFKKNDKEKEV